MTHRERRECSFASAEKGVERENKGSPSFSSRSSVGKEETFRFSWLSEKKSTTSIGGKEANTEEEEEEDDAAEERKEGSEAHASSAEQRVVCSTSSRKRQYQILQSV